MKPGDLVTYRGCRSIKWGGFCVVTEVRKMGTVVVRLPLGSRLSGSSKVQLAEFKKLLRGGYERGLRLITDSERALLVAGGFLRPDSGSLPSTCPPEENAP